MFLAGGVVARARALQRLYSRGLAVQAELQSGVRRGTPHVEAAMVR